MKTENIEAILSSIGLDDEVEFTIINNAMSDTINWNNIHAFPIPESQWSHVIGNVVILESASGGSTLGRLIEATIDIFKIIYDYPKYSSQIIDRSETISLYAVQTLRNGEHSPIEIYETISNDPELASSCYLFEVLLLKMSLRESASKWPYIFVNGIIDTLNKLPDRIIAANKQIGSKRLKELTILKDTLTILLNGKHTNPLISGTLRAKSVEILEGLNEVEKNISLINKSADTGNNRSKDEAVEVIQRKNNFNKMPLPQVERWFMKLAQNNSINGEPFLTEEQVKYFIDRAFLGNKEVHKLTLNYGSREKLSLWKLFYQYYQNCVSSETGIEPSIQCRDRYIRLLTDNFTNFAFDEVKRNFSTSNQNKKDWNLLK